MVFQYGDGTVSYIEGKDVERFWVVMKDLSIFMSIHPGGPKWPTDLDWKKVPLEEARDIFK